MMTDPEANYHRELIALGTELCLTLGADEERILDQLGKLSHEFAKQLITLGYPQLIESRLADLDFKNTLQRPFYPLWTVDGMLSKKGRPTADSWMQCRGLNWRGNVKLLRAEIEDALVRGEVVPQIGFDISLTTLQRSRFVN
ncbi:hypothetical protein [Bradyrhizobium sp. CSS354]|uniref:hypothetical protein n=1 Tax=Bradyrhizobium sp. CSS354 TaxID=2699172 RepID=UPI0023B1758E|nr:hypothetical protein [Bradyrhizobium sp. CSS354]MDE5464713.1 hypothetical protein [Bradyrhizobium sp. CSS354]